MPTVARSSDDLAASLAETPLDLITSHHLDTSCPLGGFLRKKIINTGAEGLFRMRCSKTCIPAGCACRLNSCTASYSSCPPAACKHPIDSARQS